MVTFTNKPIFVFLKARKFSVFKCCSHFLGKVSLFFVCVSNVSILSIKDAEGIGRLAPASGHTRQATCVNVRSKTNR